MGTQESQIIQEEIKRHLEQEEEAFRRGIRESLRRIANAQAMIVRIKEEAAAQIAKIEESMVEIKKELAEAKLTPTDPKIFV